jgi:DNA processing protein
MMNRVTPEIRALLSIHTEHIGSATLLNLKKRFGSYERAVLADDRALYKAHLTWKQINSIHKRKNLINRLITIVEQLNIKFLLYGEKDYPRRLVNIEDKPAVLYLRGELPDLRSISVVGSRHFTSYGQIVACEIGKAAGEMGITLVSGLAYGIDSFAHQSVVDVQGVTVGVLGCGIEKIYPATHSELALEMIKYGGGVVTEFPILTPSYPSNFPQRNRIIAGLTPVTIVVEADKESGAMITAGAAAKYHRDIWAVPGDITRVGSAGPNSLLDRNLPPYLSPNDLAQYFNIKKTDSPPQLNLSKEEENIFNAIPKSGIHIDKLIEALQLDITELSSKVIMLELKGLIKHQGAGVYRRII